MSGRTVCVGGGVFRLLDRGRSDHGGAVAQRARESCVQGDERVQQEREQAGTSLSCVQWEAVVSPKHRTDTIQFYVAEINLAAWRKTDWREPCGNVLEFGCSTSGRR